MTLPHFGHLGYIGSFVSLVALIFDVLCVIVWFVQSIRTEPRDRVVRFQALAFGTLFLGLLLGKVFGFWLPGALIWLVLFFVLTTCVVYFGITTWLRRGKQRPTRLL
jgi:hypothetical protein